jgi:hypothetical protein
MTFCRSIDTKVGCQHIFDIRAVFMLIVYTSLQIDRSRSGSTSVH